MAPEIDSGFSALVRVGELEKRVGELEVRLRTVTQAVMYLARMGDGRPEPPDRRIKSALEDAFGNQL